MCFSAYHESGRCENGAVLLGKIGLGAHNARTRSAWEANGINTTPRRLTNIVILEVSIQAAEAGDFRWSVSILSPKHGIPGDHSEALRRCDSQ